MSTREESAFGTSAAMGCRTKTWFGLEPDLIDPIRCAEASLISTQLVERMFDSLPGTLFVAKDDSLTYVGVSRGMAQACGAPDSSAMLGRSDRDFFAEATWRSYEAFDSQVIRSTLPIRDEIDLAFKTRGPPLWLLWNRFPIRGLGGATGVAATGRQLNVPTKRYGRMAGVSRALRHIYSTVNHSGVGMADLVEAAKIPSWQLQETFIELFGLPPLRYAMRVRLNVAIEMLRTGASITEIAHACGYADQSAFTRRFRAAIGMPPSQYRTLSARTPR